MSNPELKPDYLEKLLVNGYTDEVRGFTRRLLHKPDSVLALERVFDELVSDAAIDWEGTASQEDFFLRTEQRLEEMDTFLAAMPRPYASCVVMLNHGPEVTVEIGWQDLLAGQVVWDRWTAAVDDPVMAFASIGFLFDTRDYRWEAKKTEAEESPLYRYHPERFKANRDYAGEVGSFYNAQVDPTSGMLTLDQLNEVMRPVNMELNRSKARDHPLAARTLAQSGSRTGPVAAQVDLGHARASGSKRRGGGRNRTPLPGFLDTFARERSRPPIQPA